MTGSIPPELIPPKVPVPEQPNPTVSVEVGNVHAGADRAGWRTTEFWVTLAALAASVYLFSIGKDEAAAAMLAVSGGSYAVSRGFAKRAGALLLAGLAFTGCATDPTVRVDAIEPALVSIMARHDNYVAADDALTADERAIYWKTTELVREVLAEARAASVGVVDPNLPKQ